MRKKLIITALAPVLFALGAGNLGGDEFDQEDIDRWQEQFMQVVQEGRALWTDGTLSFKTAICGSASLSITGHFYLSATGAAESGIPRQRNLTL